MNLLNLNNHLKFYKFLLLNNLFLYELLMYLRFSISYILYLFVNYFLKNFLLPYLDLRVTLALLACFSSRHCATFSSLTDGLHCKRHKVRDCIFCPCSSTMHPSCSLFLIPPDRAPLCYPRFLCLLTRTTRASITSDCDFFEGTRTF